MNRFHSFLTICLTVVAFHVAARGDIIISYAGGTIPSGGPGFLNVLISSNATAPPDSLDSFSAHFLINPIGGAVAGGLQFLSPQNDSQLGVGGVGGYVFNTDSLGEIFGGPLGLVSTATNPNDEYIGGDGTFSGLGFNLDMTTGSNLLFRLNLDATLANPGDMYSIALVNDLSTSFLDPAFSPLNTDAGSFNSFTITTSAAPVPEPSTGVLLLLGTIGAEWYRRRRCQGRRRQ